MKTFDKLIENLYFEQQHNLAIFDQTLKCYNSNCYKHIIKPNYENIELYLTVLDVDNLKKLNDTLGHDNGTKLLKGLITCISAVLSKDNIIIRYGGDEFIILSKYPINDKMIQFSFMISYGIVFKTKDMSFDKCFELADKDMYIWKRKKKEKLNEEVR